MHLFKSRAILLGYCMECFASEAQDIAEIASAYARGEAPNGEILPEASRHFGPADAGEMPIWNASYCESIFDNFYENAMEADGDFTYEQLEQDWMEFTEYLIGFFGAENCADLYMIIKGE